MVDLYTKLRKARSLKGEDVSPVRDPPSGRGSPPARPLRHVYYDDFLHIQAQTASQCASFKVNKNFRTLPDKDIPDWQDTGYFEKVAEHEEMYFEPTYPYTPTYDPKKPRIPGFADRCFVRLVSPTNIEVQMRASIEKYGSLREKQEQEGMVKTALIKSDHAPIYAVVKVALGPPPDSPSTPEP